MTSNIPLALFQIPTTLIDRYRGEWPERMTTEFRVVGRGEKPRDVAHASAWTLSKRQIAQEGRNGLYSIVEESSVYDNHGGGNSPSPHRLGLKLQALFIGYAKGTLTRDEALDQLIEFEKEYPEIDPNTSLKGRIKPARQVLSFINSGCKF